MLPTIEQYRDTLHTPHGLLRSLTDIEPERDIYGDVIGVAGNKAAVFKVWRDGKPLMLKCYFKANPGANDTYDYIAAHTSPLLSRVGLLREEFFVYGDNGIGRWVDVVAGEWAEGRTLAREMELAVRRALAARQANGRQASSALGDYDRTPTTQRDNGQPRGDVQTLSALTRNFCDLAAQLLESPWAHGDLKPENIVVEPGGVMKLIDYDALWFPGRVAARSVETGTPGYQHPRRDYRLQGKAVDHYPIALIAASLALIAREPGLYKERGIDESVLFDPEAILAGRSTLYNRLMEEAVADGSEHSGQTTVDSTGSGRELTAAGDPLARLLTMLSSPGLELPELNDAIKNLNRRR